MGDDVGQQGRVGRHAILDPAPLDRLVARIGHERVAQSQLEEGHDDRAVLAGDFLVDVATIGRADAVERRVEADGSCVDVDLDARRFPWRPDRLPAPPGRLRGGSSSVTVPSSALATAPVARKADATMNPRNQRERFLISEPPCPPVGPPAFGIRRDELRGLRGAEPDSGIAEAEHPGVDVVAVRSAIRGIPAVVVPVRIDRQHRLVSRDARAAPRGRSSVRCFRAG